MKNLKAILAVLALTPVLVACGGEKPVEITNVFGQKMEVLCDAGQVRYMEGQGAANTEFATVDQWVEAARQESGDNPFTVGMARGYFQGAIDSACN